MNIFTVEICAPSYRSAIAAQRGGASRIELCSELSCGGVTPSAGLIQQVTAALSIPVNVLLRPRSGDFLYTSDEVETVLRDIAFCAWAGVRGVVVGALTADATIDCDAARAWLKEARSRGLSTTFHRAIDSSADILDALEAVCSLGYDRVLTSGGHPTAWEGREVLRTMVGMTRSRSFSFGSHPGSISGTSPGSHSSSPHIQIMPGSGVNPDNIRDIAEFTGCSEIHLSASRRHPSAMRTIAGIAPYDDSTVHSDETTIRQAVQALI